MVGLSVECRRSFRLPAAKKNFCIIEQGMDAIDDSDSGIKLRLPALPSSAVAAIWLDHLACSERMRHAR